VPKMKSHRGAAKRFKKTATGKVKYKSFQKSHFRKENGKKKTSTKKVRLTRSG